MTNQSSLQTLAKDLAGEILEPSQPSFDEHKTAFYDEFNERTPRAIVRVADAADVGRVIGYARDTGTGLAVRAGGHSALGHSSPDGGLLLDLSRLDSIEVDPDWATAWAGGGVLAGDFTKTTGEHGLVTGFGDTPSVGVSGITLGGGVGFLHRKLGLTIDSLLAAEIVTADGETRVVDEENDPDLFWAIRGGGGNFGVLTRMKFRLHPIDAVVGGMMILPATPGLVADLVAASQEASDDLSVIAGVAVAPPLPFLPSEVHGRLIVMAFLVHAGEPDTAEREVGRFRSLATPLVDGVQAMMYPEIYGEEEPPHPAAMSVRSVFSDGITVEDAGAAIDALTSATADMSVLQIRVLGGAVARVPDDATAFGHRSRAMILNVAAAYQDPGKRPEHEAWVSDLSNRLAAGTPGAYLNFLGDDSPEAVRAAFPASTWERLVDVKTKYDQGNLFSSNHNIAPRD
jgi:FAD/FMN-containing dehydrogenase